MSNVKKENFYYKSICLLGVAPPAMTMPPQMQAPPQQQLQVESDLS